MYGAYSNYNMPPYNGGMYPPNGGSFGSGYGVMNGAMNSFDFFNRFAMTLSSTSEALHITFSSAIRLIASLRSLSSEFDNFRTTFSAVVLLKRVLLFIRSFVYRFFGLPSKNFGESKIVPPENFLGRSADRVLLLSMTCGLITFLKRFVSSLYRRVSPYHEITAFLPTGQSIEILFPKSDHAQNEPFVLSPSGRRCCVIITPSPDSPSPDLPSPDSPSLDSPSHNSILNSLELIAPNGGKIPLKVNMNDDTIFAISKWVKRRERCDFAARGEVRSNDGPRMGFYEGNEKEGVDFREERNNLNQSFSEIEQAISSFNNDGNFYSQF